MKTVATILSASLFVIGAQAAMAAPAVPAAEHQTLSLIHI